MFANQRGNAGLGSIIAVAVLGALYLASAGLLLKTYREGPDPAVTHGCQVVCRPSAVKSPTHG